MDHYETVNQQLAIRAALAENYIERRRVCQQKRRQRQADVRIGLTKKQEQVALRILELTNSNHDAAALWISQQKNFTDCERKLVHAKYADFLKDKLESSWASAIRSLRDQESTDQRERNIRMATAFVQGAQLAQWVRELNVDKGLAPPSRHLVQQMGTSDIDRGMASSSGRQLPVMPPIGAVGADTDLEPLLTRRYNKRVQRWRKKRNVRLSKIRGRETPSTSEITEKVPWRSKNN